jgi:hypothetical protein
VPASCRLRPEAFSGSPVLGRGQKQQAPGSAVLSAFPGVLELSDRPMLPLPTGDGDGRWALLADPLEASGDREPYGGGDSPGTIRKRAMGEAIAELPPEGGTGETAPARISGPVRSEWFQMWLRRVITLLYRARTAGLDRIDRGYRLGLPLGWGSWPEDGRSVAMGCGRRLPWALAAGLVSVMGRTRMMAPIVN